MLLMAEPFATTPAGYLTGLGTPIVALLVAAMWRAWAGRLKKQDDVIAKLVESSTESNKALALILADHNHVAATVASNTIQINALEKSTAVLAAQVDDHHRWVERQQAAGNRNAL